MKTNFKSSNHLTCLTHTSFHGMLRSVFILFILFICLDAHAQGPSGNPSQGGGTKVSPDAPASNIIGPLKAYVNGDNIVVTSKMVTDGEPITAYSIENNTSGASIVSQGPIQYDNTTGTMTQAITINPGSIKGSFNVSLTVTTGSGTCTSSKSVTVTNLP